MRKRLLPCSVATLLAAASASGQCAPRWQPGAAFASHINGNVAALLPWDPDGAGPQPEVLVVAGSFTMIGTTAIHRLAVWNGSSWSPLGTPLPFTPACLAVFQGDLIAAGHLNGPPGAISAIARWDGSAWQPMGAGFNDSVLALQVVGNQLFAGGFFSASGALPLSRVAVWDGGKWANVGGGVTAGQAFPSVNALAGPVKVYRKEHWRYHK